MSTDPSADQPSAIRVLADAAASLARGTDLDAAIGGLIAGAADSTGAALAALFVQDPEVGGLQLVAAHGFASDALADLEAEVTGDADHPIAVAARDARPNVGRAGPGPDGAGTTAADLPLVVARDGIDLPLGVLSLGWSGERTIDDDERALLSATADLIALSLDRVRLTTLVHERSEWFERLAQTDALTGLANSRLRRPGPRARGRPGGASGQRALGDRLRRRRFRQLQRAGRPRGRRRRAPPGRGRARRARSAWSTPSPGSAPTSSWSSPRDLPARSSRGGSSMPLRRSTSPATG